MSWLLLSLSLAATPGELRLPEVRVEVHASEDLEPDRLAALARPGVTLWLRTRSNVLRNSLRELLHRTTWAYVEIRPPFARGVFDPFLGSVRPWIREVGLDVAAIRRAPAGRFALDVEGPLSAEVAGRVHALRPFTIRWNRGGWPSADEWKRARELTSVTLSEVPADAVSCADVPPRTHVAVMVPLERAGRGVCGLPLTVVLDPRTRVEDVRAELVLYASSGFSLEVGADTGRADAALRLIEELAAATPSSLPEASTAMGRDGGDR